MEENKNRELGQEILKGTKRIKSVQLDFTDINEEFVGTFKFHHPSLIERMNIGVAKSRMLDGLEGRVDVLTDNIAHMTATLNFVLDEAPEWFDVNNPLLEYEILDKVFDTYIEWFNSFRKQNK